MIPRSRLPLAIGLAAFLSSCASAPQLNPWAGPLGPSAGISRSIGSPSAGCLAGAWSLPPDGEGFELMRVTRRRFYGHERLVRFIEAYGEALVSKGVGPVLIGDLGQARGGPSPSGHRSHQTGLDVDFWFWRPDDLGSRSLTLDERERVAPPAMVAPDQLGVAAIWTDAQTEMLHTAAEFDEVERIFVHPAIKKDLCAVYRGQAWLRKLRPWWGHDDHFHVRLGCSPGDADCRAQEAVPPGDGCDSTLDWWFTEEARAKGEEKPPTGLPKLPQGCEALLSAP